MNVRIERTRMHPHTDRAYAYDGAVLLSELGLEHMPGCITICKDGAMSKASGRYVSFVDATRPAELDAMELGWERYQAALEHEKRANATLLALAKATFPELEPATKWPTLWVVIPTLDVPSETRLARFDGKVA
jgi:hypothetical protein